MAAIQGKWHATAREDGVVRYVQATQDDGEEFIVAKVWAGDDDDYEGTARLVAAAPELLAVCKAIASDLSLFPFTDGEYRLSEQSAGVILQSLREVIAKVEGRDQ